MVGRREVLVSFRTCLPEPFHEIYAMGMGSLLQQKACLVVASIPHCVLAVLFAPVHNAGFFLPS